MRSISVSICLSAFFSLGFAVQHRTFRSDVFDTLADIMKDSLPTNFLEDFSMGSLAAKVPLLQQQQQYPSSTTSGGPLQYVQNLAPLGLGQFLSGIFGSAPSTSSPGRPGVSTQYPAYPSNGDASLMSALTSIAKYDDLKCVPRLLCEVAAGGRPGEKQRAFGGRNTVLSLLSLIGGEMTSPVVVFGRAMLLGLAVQGEPGTCYSAYPSCPRDPDRLVDYLNNHRGGLFRFFSATGLPAYYTQQYSQARIQTSHQRLSIPQTSLSPPKVTINTDKGHRHFLPQRKVLTHKTLPPLNSRPSSEFQKPLTFPGDRGRLYNGQQDERPVVEDTTRPQHFAFPDSAQTESSREEVSTESYPSPVNHSIHRLPPPVAVHLPDRTGTGELRIDNDESTYGPASFPSRYKRDVLSKNRLNTLEQRMDLPLNDELYSKSARNMKFPSDTYENSIHFPESTRKFNSFNRSNEHPVWDKPRYDVTRDSVKFPKSTVEIDNRHELKRHLMKFPSDINHGDDVTKVSFNFDIPKTKKDTRRMKFPDEHSDKNQNPESNHILNKDHNNVSKVKFQNIQEGFKETPSYGFIFPYSGSKDSNNVAQTSFNHETSKIRNTRRMKFPVEYYDESGKSESNVVITKDINDISKVRFQNVPEGSDGKPLYSIVFSQHRSSSILQPHELQENLSKNKRV